MNINFYNNITDKKNPTIIVVSKPSDLLNVNKFPLLLKDIILKLKNVNNISSKLNNSKIIKLNIIINNEILDFVIFKPDNFSKYNAQLDGSLLYRSISDSKYEDINVIISRNILNKNCNNDELNYCLNSSNKIRDYYLKKNTL